MNITAVVWTAGFHWWRSGNITRTHNVSEYVRLSVCRLSVTLVHPTQAVVIFGNISTAFGTSAIR